MKKMMSKMSFRARDIREAVKSEPWSHKARLIGFAVVMAGISTTLQTFLDNIQYRSGQHQRELLGGNVAYADLKTIYDDDYWIMKNTHAFLENKPLKDVKYLSMGDWKDTEYTDYSYDGAKWVAGTAYSGPNGNEFANANYYTQTERGGAYRVEQIRRQYLEENDPIQFYQEKYDDWEDMHKDIIWFDTGACWGNLIGDTNEVSVLGTSTRFYDNDLTGDERIAHQTSAGWWQYSGDETPSQVNYDQYGQPSSTTPERDNAWDTAVSVLGQVNLNKEDLYRDTLKAKLDVYEDCDRDCQKRGSGITLAAGLLSGAYGLIGLNALFMFCGAWRSAARICSIWCTLFACVFQFAIQITVGVLVLGSPYTMVCGRSLTKTMGEGINWTMSDDLQIFMTIWGAGWFLMLPFLCCGWLSTYLASKTVA